MFGAPIGMPCMARDANVLPEGPVVLNWSYKLDKQHLHRSLTAVCSRLRRLPFVVHPARSGAGLLTSSRSIGLNLIVT
jgi:hypothetical protein